MCFTIFCKLKPESVLSDLNIKVTTSNRLHDPGAARTSFELFYKQMVLTGKCKGAWEKRTP